MYLRRQAAVSRDSCRGRSPFYLSTFVDVLMDSRSCRGGTEASHCRACSIVVREASPFAPMDGDAFTCAGSTGKKKVSDLDGNVGEGAAFQRMS